MTGAQTVIETGRTYVLLGVEHILSGIDHLLFVLALMLLIRDRWMLVATISAFTLAHSITLAGSALGYLSLPQKPVEAAIALSIAFVARELARTRPDQRRYAETYPWVVAFVFGLLHGFGFAGALKETGLPQMDVPLALLAFNLGVEAGQLSFVAAALVTFKAAAALSGMALAPARIVAAYAIGTGVDALARGANRQLLDLTRGFRTLRPFGMPAARARSTVEVAGRRAAPSRGVDRNCRGRRPPDRCRSAGVDPACPSARSPGRADSRIRQRSRSSGAGRLQFACKKRCTRQNIA